MAPHTIPFPNRRLHPHARLAPVLVFAPRPTHAEAEHLALNAEDGTLQLLRSGFMTAGVAALAAMLTLFVFGGIGPDGPCTSLGWLALMVAMMSMPFGLLMLLLGGAKWLRNHWLSSHAAQAPKHRSRN